MDLFLQQQALDTSTPAGKALLQMSGVFAEFERAMIVERTKAGLERARARGVQIGRPPIGNDVADAIRNLRAQGLAMDKIARTLRCGKGVLQRVCIEFDRERKE